MWLWIAAFLPFLPPFTSRLSPPRSTQHSFTWALTIPADSAKTESSSPNVGARWGSLTLSQAGPFPYTSYFNFTPS